MKHKSLLLSALMLAVTLSACSQPTVEQKTEKFNIQAQKISEKLNTDLTAVAADSTLTPEQAEAKSEAIYDAAVDKYTRLCLKTIKQNPDNSLGVEAAKSVYYLLEDEELEAALGLLSEENLEEQEIAQIWADLQARKKVAVGQPFVDFEVNGVKFSDYVGKGKWILVDFWASWCGPCKREVPNIKEVYDLYHGDDFDVLSVAVWDKAEDTIKAADELGIVWNQIIDAQKIPSEAYGFNSIPQLMLFTPDGTIYAKGEDLRGANMKATISKALGR